MCRKCSCFLSEVFGIEVKGMFFWVSGSDVVGYFRVWKRLKLKRRLGCFRLEEGVCVLRRVV